MTTGRNVLLLTCSMKRDLPLFVLQAETVDIHVDPTIRHLVVVPRADLAAFRPYANARREIVAQEDIWRAPIFKLPQVPEFLARFKPALRRPIYVTPQLKTVRGWMLQQLIKIEVARAAKEAAIVHMDSDAAFFRAFTPADVFAGNSVRVFEAEGATANPMHQQWVEVCAELLGIPVPATFPFHYVENCVVWDTAVLRAMLDRIETTHGQPFHRLLFSRRTFSEYQLYGLFARSFPDQVGHVAEPVSFCNSVWPSEGEVPTAEAVIARTDPKHVAFALQSTEPLPIEMRRKLLAAVASRFAAD